MKILVTGGAGYIGSHTCLELLNEGYDVVVVDNLSNSSEEALKRVEKITEKKLTFYKIDVLDEKALENVFVKENIQCVIHFAGLKAVGESVDKPLEYYQNNITGTIILCKVMKKYNVKKLVFSSSATVYGEPAFVPITEKCPKGKITNPYGHTKSMIEQILIDVNNADKSFSVAILRYFNPVGAYKSGDIGEDPKGIPNNLVPYISQVAVGKRPHLNIFGDDYETKDGTGVRDYIHVVDLAIGHIKSIKKIEKENGVFIYNLGTGNGYSVLEMVHTFEKVSGKKIDYVITKRRDGDIGECYADPKKANEELGFVAKRELLEMCQDSYRWQCKNPNGYEN